MDFLVKYFFIGERHLLSNYWNGYVNTTEIWSRVFALPSHRNKKSAVSNPLCDRPPAKDPYYLQPILLNLLWHIICEEWKLKQTISFFAWFFSWFFFSPQFVTFWFILACLLLLKSGLNALRLPACVLRISLLEVHIRMPVICLQKHIA